MNAVCEYLGCLGRLFTISQNVLSQNAFFTPDIVQARVVNT
jgi:hypothetical protein